jgi:small nuclear ribonucleoprotein (snRNP)-like protein
MVFPKRRHFKRRHFEKRFHEPPGMHTEMHTEMQDLVHPEDTGSEAAYLKSLIDSRATVTVVMNDGERLHGRIRYYDSHCFSIGLSATGPRIFLRKASVSYIAED